jgi:hypothetical protein
MRTAVDKVKKGKGRVVNARFSVMCGHYLYDPDFWGCKRKPDFFLPTGSSRASQGHRAIVLAP